MRILHICETDLGGGAGIYAFRLHSALRSAGVDSTLLVSRKFSDDPHVLAVPAATAPFATTRRLLRERLEKFPRWRYRRTTQAPFTTLWATRSTLRAVQQCQPDVINLHWIGNGFFPVSALPGLDTPLVWTLHDMWPYTGGCHYSGTCTRHEATCGACPVLGSAQTRDLSTRLQRRKAALFAEAAARLHFVNLSEQSSRLAQRSTILRNARTSLIPFGVPLEVFQAHPRATARSVLGLPANRLLIGFGALALNERRKGADLLVAALQHLRQTQALPPFTLVTFGQREHALTTDADIPVVHLGPLRDPTSIALALSALDTFVSPSRQECAPTVVVEALACGTPVAGFAVGVLPDLAAHGAKAFAASEESVPALATAIAQAARQPDDDEARRDRRTQIAPFIDLRVMAERYRQLYAQMMVR